MNPTVSTPQAPEREVVDSGQITALLDRGASFEGRLTSEGTVRIGGQFKGEIFTRDTLVVDPGASVEAQIEADSVVLLREIFLHAEVWSCIHQLVSQAL